MPKITPGIYEYSQRPRVFGRAARAGHVSAPRKRWHGPSSTDHWRHTMAFVTLRDLGTGPVDLPRSALPQDGAPPRPARWWQREKWELLCGAAGSMLTLGPLFRGGALLGLD